MNKLEDQLVSFETAKLAKEKGFESVIGLGHQKPRGNYYNSNGELNGDCLKELKSIVKKTDEFKLISAPTQSLLQKWLREIHDIDVIATFYSDDVNYGYHWQRSIKGVEMFVSGNDSDGISYEEALEVGLQEALKLI